MASMFLQRMKENLVGRRSELSSWLRQSSDEVVATRVGPNGTEAIARQIEPIAGRCRIV